MKRVSMTSIQIYSLLFLIPLLVFSYLPVLSFGVLSGTTIDLSFLYAYLLFGLLLNIPTIMPKVSLLSRSPSWLILTVLTLYIWLTVLWSPNLLRGTLTAAFFTILYLLVSLIMVRTASLRQSEKTVLFRLFIGAFLIAILWATWQILADSTGTSSAFTGLRSMYSGDVFGIARPSSFALEPQFFGSLLLIPFTWSLYALLSATIAKRIKMIAVSVFVLSVIFLIMTISRGALLAAIVATLALVVFMRPSVRSMLRTIGLGMLSILVAATIMFGFASVRNDSMSGSQSLSRVVSHLTLGTISPTSTQPDESTSTKAMSPGIQVSSADGYVSSSTASRISQVDKAIDIWQSSPQVMLFGVGSGGFGQALHNLDNSEPVSSIVNNYYIEQLVETGIIGLLTLTSLIVSVAVGAIRRKNYFLTALLFAFVVQWLFFSGNANIIHVWLVFGIAISLQISTKKSSRLLQ